ncbi:MAG: DUF5071 domain-containing protein [Roseovarius sp.]|nr:DUF5071 domain-containing protein [Roseovarius sp.]
MGIDECIPSNKHDLDALESAKAIGFPALNPRLPDLLEWLQDANWPVAKPTASVLSEAGSEITPHIKVILGGDDAIWKYWTIELLVRNLNPDVFNDLRSDLLHLASHPAASDKLEHVDTLAKQVLAGRHL